MARLAALLSIAALTFWMLPISSAQPNQTALRGSVVDSAHKRVADALVLLKRQGATGARETKTDPAGAFVFASVEDGTYILSAEKSGLHARATITLTRSPANDKPLELMLAKAAGGQPASGGPMVPGQTMDFTDEPNFAVAGVTDWTAVGGHGSDSILRTSEDLARETAALRQADNAGTNSTAAEAAGEERDLRAGVVRAPDDFRANHQLGAFYLRMGRYREAIAPLLAAYKTDPTNYDTELDLARAYTGGGDYAEARDHVLKVLARKDTADAHRLAGELDEKLGEPLAAVHEFERAARLDPSERNYLEWGSELLVHRALWQAQEVFKKGAAAYPKSARMLTALGSALFAGALYEEAARRLCEASDLSPAEAEPYLFMGKIQMAAPAAYPCVEERLARFAQAQPDNSPANYLYAMALWKGHGPSVGQPLLQQVEGLLTKAVTLDPKCADAYLQLGILSLSEHDLPKAVSFYLKAIDADPQLGEAHYRLGVAYDRMGEAAKAHEEFRLHDEIEKRQAEAVERERREVKQFVMAPQKQPASVVIQ